jgi:hypothetical protein
MILKSTRPYSKLKPLVILLFALSLPIIFGACNGTEPATSRTKETSRALEEAPKLTRTDLPIPVSDSTWLLFEQILEIENIAIDFDPTWQNGNVSRNVSSQFWFTPAKYKMGIVIYDRNISEETLAHEALHALKVLQGYPMFVPRGFPERKTIINLDNELQHFDIFERLEKMGFHARTAYRKRWREGIEYLNASMHIIPPDAPRYTLDVVGAANTLGGIASGMDIEEIRTILPTRLLGGVDKAVKIHEVSRKYDLTNNNHNFELHLRIASILELTREDVIIGIMNFENRNRSFYDPVSGKLLYTK